MMKLRLSPSLVSSTRKVSVPNTWSSSLGSVWKRLGARRVHTDAVLILKLPRLSVCTCSKAKASLSALNLRSDRLGRVAVVDHFRTSVPTSAIKFELDSYFEISLRSVTRSQYTVLRF